MKILKNNLLGHNSMNNINCDWCLNKNANIIFIWQNINYSHNIYCSFYCNYCFKYVNKNHVISLKNLNDFSNINDLQSFLNSFYKYTLLQ